MTKIQPAAARTTTPTTTTPEPSTAPVGEAPAPSTDASSSDGGFPILPVAIGGGIAAAVLGAGALYLAKRPIQSSVIGMVDGVELLSNPRTTKEISKHAWGVPTEGGVFGAGQYGRVSLEHVDQGALGDCWNVAGMGAIAHRRPEAIEQLVRESGDAVIVNLPERPVAVTKELPLQDGSPVYGGSGPDDPVHWPAYVEKAQAALARDGYRSLEGGWARESFDQLLGTTSKEVTGSSRIIDDIEARFAAKEPLAIATRSDDTARMQELNVHGNHYYVVKDVKGTGAERQVELHNPWGDKHPTKALTADELDEMFEALDTPSVHSFY